MDNLFKKLGINVVNSNLYDVAFLHSSYTNEKNSKEDYERLEFLGDAVLELVVSDYLYNNYHLVEGEMTKTRANYVCEKALSTYALEFNSPFPSFIYSGKLNSKAYVDNAFSHT